MNRKKLFKENPSVTLVGKGYKRKDGQIVYDKNGNPVEAIVIGVAEKKPLRELSKCEVIPKKIKKHRFSLRSTTTDVVETGIIRALPTLPPRNTKAIPDYQKKVRPINSGVSCGHKDITAGTIGPVVTAWKITPTKIGPCGKESGLLAWLKQLIRWILGKEETEDPGVTDPPENPGPIEKIIGFVTNNHVGANSTIDGVGAKIGDPVLQQGPYDGGTLKETCGKLHTIIPLFSNKKNFVDACFIESTVETIGSVFGLNCFPKEIVPRSQIKLGMEVTKQGRTTGTRLGYIDMTEVELPVWYDDYLLQFKNQIVVKSKDGRSFSEGGDSGSLILTMDGRALALLFAGGPNDTIGNPMYVVESEFQAYGLQIQLGIA